MKIKEFIALMEKYRKCPNCGNTAIGNGQGGIIIEDETFTRICKCGFKITVNENDQEVSA